MRTSTSIVIALVAACSATSPPAGRDRAPSIETSTPPATKTDVSTTLPKAGCTANDGRLAISASIEPAPHADRIPMRRVRMTIENISNDSIRILRVRPEAFRYGTSSLVITADGASPIFAPEPRPHGYLITEEDFALLDPGTQIDLEQSFTIDPMVRGSGTNTERSPGFARGTVASVTWTLENTSTTFPGGASTLDGVTKPLFGGGPVPLLWTGELMCSMTWTVPD